MAAFPSTDVSEGWQATCAVQAVALNLQKASDPIQAGQETPAADAPSDAAASKGKGGHAKTGLLSRVFGNKSSATSASHQADAKKAEPRTSSGHRPSVSRESGDGGSSGLYDRASLNPVERIVAAMSTAVDSVASEGKALHNFVLKPEDPEDEQVLAKGLKKQDSMEYTRARLAQSRTRSGSGPGLHELRSIEGHDGVEAVAVENAHLSAKALLKGLVKNLPPDTMREVEVVTAQYSLDTGAVSVLKRGWFSGRSIYFE
ncbi:hypothetical protein WJX73_007102 [Symbiochloris irregularis]|uniref:Uncharacterized protein n=1 Tax=Symbiochloris irregularis TaxID=706552 RepID=A0AAW1NM15_9CHLO